MRLKFIFNLIIVLSLVFFFAPHLLVAQNLPSTTPLLPPPDGHRYESQDFFNTPPESENAETQIMAESEQGTEQRQDSVAGEKRSVFQPWLIFLVLIVAFGLVWKYASDKKNEV